MAFQQVPDSAEIRIVFNVCGEDISNYYYAQHTGPYARSNIDALATAIDSLAASSFLALMSQNDAYIRTDVRGLDTEFDFAGTDNTNAAIGVIGTIPHPNNVAFVVRQISTLTGRSARGRVYLGGIPRNAVSSGTDLQNIMIGATADLWVAAVEGVRNTIDATGVWNAALVSRYNDGAKRAVGLVFGWSGSNYSTLTLGTRRNRLR